MVENEVKLTTFNFMLNQLMLEAMDNLKRKFFSGSYAEKRDEMHQVSHEIYCESQNVNNYVAKEEQGEEIEVKENKKKRFVANYKIGRAHV